MHQCDVVDQPVFTPALQRMVVARILAWSSAGAVALVGECEALSSALRGAGVRLVAEGEPAVSRVVVLWDSGVDDGLTDGASTDLAELPCDMQTCPVVLGPTLDAGRRAVWEQRMLHNAWRKHPRGECVAPYGELDRVTGVIMAAFEPLPVAALERYPLDALKAERDLHTDMTREAGRRSDAHMARYTQAARHVRTGDRVIDVACGLGYGSYQIASLSRAASFHGVDASAYAVDYANTCFAGDMQVPMHFSIGDAQDLAEMADGSADFAVSVETLEHLPDPDRLLAELHRVLSPGGLVYASVPNDWADETGEDPNPFHFHVYDWTRLEAQFRRNGFVIEKAWLQDAGGGQKRHLSGRSMLEIDPRGEVHVDGEWLLVLARRQGEDEPATEAAEWPALVSDALRRGDHPEAVALLTGVTTDFSHPLQPVLAHSVLAILHARAGEAAQAAAAWEMVASRAKPALEDDGLRATAASLLALAYAAQADASAGLSDLFVAHPDAIAQLPVVLQATPLQLEIDRQDRAYLDGTSSASGAHRLSNGQVQALLDAKQWLDGKYHEHMARIGELDVQVDELERARRWLDGQYHTLSEQVRQLRTGAGAVD